MARHSAASSIASSALPALDDSSAPHAHLPELRIAYLADTPEIVPRIAAWQHLTWGHLPGALSLQQRESRLHAHLQRLAIPTTFVAWLGDEAVGAAALIANDMPALPEWIPWLASVFVAPEVRRQGIGAHLVERVAGEAVALGYPRLYLYTLDQMDFYASLGWQRSHLRAYRGHDMTVMTRDLVVHPPRFPITPAVTAP
jgi:N-acetylglutamate synthase-like GNAT family acetyltransferase